MNPALRAAIEGAADGQPWALVGAEAAQRWGAQVQGVELVEVLAEGPPATGASEPTGVERGLRFWDLSADQADERAGTVRWWAPQPHHAAFVAHALDTLPEGTPPTLGPDALIALWLRTKPSLAVALLAGGAVDVPTQRTYVERWLGPYAVDDFDLLLQEAEWALMKQRHTGGGGSLH